MRKTICVDDQTGVVAEAANPVGWIFVTVSALKNESGQPVELSFSSWTSFRHYVELSDPSCGMTLDPPKGGVASVPLI